MTPFIASAVPELHCSAIGQWKRIGFIRFCSRCCLPCLCLLSYCRWLTEAAPFLLFSLYKPVVSTTQTVVHKEVRLPLSCGKLQFKLDLCCSVNFSILVWKYRKRRRTFSSFLKMSAVDMLYSLCEEVDEGKRNRSVFAGGWLLKCTVWHSHSWKRVHVFVWTCVQVCVHQSFHFMFRVLCTYAHTLLWARVYFTCACVCVWEWASLLLTPHELNIAMLGRQTRLEHQRRNRADSLHTDPSLYPINNTILRRTAWGHRRSVKVVHCVVGSELFIW